MSGVMSATFMLSAPVIDFDTNSTDCQGERERAMMTKPDASLSTAPQQLMTDRAFTLKRWMFQRSDQTPTPVQFSNLCWKLWDKTCFLNNRAVNRLPVLTELDMQVKSNESHIRIWWEIFPNEDNAKTLWQMNKSLNRHYIKWLSKSMSLSSPKPYNLYCMK